MNKEKVCVLCLKKSKTLKQITEKVRGIICDRYYSDIITRAAVYPTKICTKCRLRCTGKLDPGNVNFPHKYIVDCTNEFELECKCEICKAAKVVCGAKQARNLPYVSVKHDQGRPRKVIAPVAKALKVCTVCLTELGRGKRHKCNVTSRCENLTSLLTDENSPPKPTEAAVSQFLKGKTMSSGTML